MCCAKEVCYVRISTAIGQIYIRYSNRYSLKRQRSCQRAKKKEELAKSLKEEAVAAAAKAREEAKVQGGK